MAFVGKQNRNDFKNNKVKKYFIKKRKKPLVLVFDENDREEFLTGFRKRKLQRKKKAQEELETELKAERKRIKQGAKDALKKLVGRADDIQVEGEEGGDAEVVDMGDHQVHVTQLDPQRLAKENNWIGANQIKFEVEDSLEDETVESDEEANEIHGMETSQRRNKRSRPPQEETLRTTKDVKRFVKKVATKKVQTSKAFQKKKDVERAKNKKKMARDERKQQKNQKLSAKKRNKNSNRNQPS